MAKENHFLYCVLWIHSTYKTGKNITKGSIEVWLQVGHLGTPRSSHRLPKVGFFSKKSVSISVLFNSLGEMIFWKLAGLSKCTQLTQSVTLTGAQNWPKQHQQPENGRSLKLRRTTWTQFGSIIALSFMSETAGRCCNLVNGEPPKEISGSSNSKKRSKSTRVLWSNGCMMKHYLIFHLNLPLKQMNRLQMIN